MPIKGGDSIASMGAPVATVGGSRNRNSHSPAAWQRNGARAHSRLPSARSLRSVSDAAPFGSDHGATANWHRAGPLSHQPTDYNTLTPAAPKTSRSLKPGHSSSNIIFRHSGTEYKPLAPPHPHRTAGSSRAGPILESGNGSSLPAENWLCSSKIAFRCSGQHPNWLCSFKNL